MHVCVRGEIVAVVDRLLINVLLNNKLRYFDGRVKSYH